MLSKNNALNLFYFCKILPSLSMILLSNKCASIFLFFCLSSFTLHYDQLAIEILHFLFEFIYFGLCFLMLCYLEDFFIFSFKFFDLFSIIWLLPFQTKIIRFIIKLLTWNHQRFLKQIFKFRRLHNWQRLFFD